jgi:hypothetical protein
MTDPLATIQAATDTVSALSVLIDTIMSTVPKIISIAAIVATRLPPPSQNSFLSKLHKIINTMAFNFGHATNAESDVVWRITPDNIKNDNKR